LPATITDAQGVGVDEQYDLTVNLGDTVTVSPSTASVQVNSTADSAQRIITLAWRMEPDRDLGLVKRAGRIHQQAMGSLRRQPPGGQFYGDGDRQRPERDGGPYGDKENQNESTFNALPKRVDGRSVHSGVG